MSNTPRLKRLLVTPGEPAGIGPDIMLKIAAQDFDAEIIAIADPDLLAQRASELDLKTSFNILESTDTAVGRQQAGTLAVIPVSMATTTIAGQLDKTNSQYVLDCLSLAARQCLDDKASAIVTGPVHKGVINEAGIPFTGHTEYLAELGHSKPVMMLATSTLRVALATTHLPLNRVSEAINNKDLDYVIHALHDFLQHNCGIEHPRIIVCGLNPHAGEDGHLGKEEIEIISPTIKACQSDGIDLLGPLPADTAFTEKYLAQADAVLAMYHDQGLPVLKHSGFGKAVNITLGLPFIRTSVDHGTALDLAGTGEADDSSMLAAINMAIGLAPTRL